MALPSICIVSELPPPPGGMAVQARLLTENLRREGHLVYNAPTNPLAQSSRWRRVKGLRGLLNLNLFLARLWPACRRADCVYILSNSYLSFFLFTFPAVALGRLFGKRVIIHYHGGSAEPFLRRWFWLARAAFGAAHAVLVPSGFLAGVFGRFGVHTRQVPNILELAQFPFRARRPLRPRIIMSRHLEAPYNVACGLRAFALLRARVPEATLTIAGGGRERASLEALAARLGVADAVEFLGDVDNARMRGLYDAADIYLNSSRVDNQPVSILEAFACGLPVVSTAVGGIPHMVTHGVDALLAPGDDAPALAAQLAALLSDEPLAQRLVENGRRRIAEHSWDNVYRKHRDLYGEGRQ